MGDVDGPTMTGRLDVVAPDQPVEAISELETSAQRQYEPNPTWLVGQDGIDYPLEASNSDGTKIWQVVPATR